MAGYSLADIPSNDAIPDSGIEMALPEFLRSHQLRAPHVMWFLGAGASAAAGIPTAWDMIWEFKRIIYCSEQGVSQKRCSDLGDPNLRRRIQQYLNSRAAEGFPAEDDPDEYAFYFQQAWPNAADRRRYIDQAIARGTASFGHLSLAACLRLDTARIVWTTNFDHLIEDACAKIMGTTGRLTTADLNHPEAAIQGMNESRWPLLVKLHGDFRSTRLKNIKDELQSQDAMLRQAMVEGCQRFGLAVVGYSGRDDSVMDILEEAIQAGRGFPHGLFWFTRSATSCLPRVQPLIERAHAAGVQAKLIVAETFDELLADVLNLSGDVPDDLWRQVMQHRPHLSSHEIPDAGQVAYPVIRTNALPVVSYPSILRLVGCTIGGTKEVRAAIERAGTDVLAVRTKSGVVAFGADHLIRQAFEPFNITEFDICSVPADRLPKARSELGLLYQAMARALASGLPLRRHRRRAEYYLLVDPPTDGNGRLEPLRDVTSTIHGKVPGSVAEWFEALHLRLDFKLGRMWLLIEPTVLCVGATTDDERQRTKDFVRERLARRYNRMWHSLLNAWIEILSGGLAQWRVSAFGIGDGIDATFEISRTTAFSHRRSAQ